MRKALWLPMAACAVAAFFVSGVSQAAMDSKEKVAVKLSAAPKVKTSARGNATFELGKDGSTLHYKIVLTGTENITMAHVHEIGDDGTPAAILAWLYPAGGSAPSLREGKLTGTLAEGDITAENLSGPLKGKTVKELFETIEYGKAGVAIHTQRNPGSELWGAHRAKEHAKMKM